MNIIGQGGKIILFMLPSLVAALLIHIYLPRFAALPQGLSYLSPVGYLLLFPGILFWSIAVVQLITGFSEGRLVTKGAYAIVRNPIYSSVMLLIFPAISVITWTWVYLIPSLFLFAGVMIFIRKEEKELTSTFGKAYEDYRAKVRRIFPF